MEPPSKYLPLECDVLTPEMVLKAERELGETKAIREKSLDELKAMIKEEPNFVAYMEDKYLLRFLRARKFDVQKAFGTLKNFYKFKKKYSGFLTGFVPSDMKHIYDMNRGNILPYRTSEGSPILMLRSEKYDPKKGSLYDVFSTCLMAIDLETENEVTQVCGAVIVLDLRDFSVGMTRHLGPTGLVRIIYYCAKMIQDVLPLRVKAMHVVNEPAYFTIVYNILKGFLTEKLKSRIYIHGSDLDSLHQYLPPDILNSELGGYAGPYDNSKLYALNIAQDSYYRKLNTCGYQGRKTVS